MPTGIYVRKNRLPLRDVICRHCGVTFQTYRKKLQSCKACCGTAWNKGLSLPTAAKQRISDTVKNRREKPIPHSVYYLLDPSTLKPRYVGFSEDPEKRYMDHLKDSDDTHKCRWITSLRKAGSIPVLSTRCIVQGALEAGRIEIALIAFLRAGGADLVNSTDGGDGFCGGKWSEEHRRKQKVYRETIGKYRPSPQKGVPQSEEHKAATLAANTPELLARRGASIKAGWARRNGAPTKRKGKGLSAAHRRSIFEGKGLDSYIPDFQLSPRDRALRQLARNQKKLDKLLAQLAEEPK